MKIEKIFVGDGFSKIFVKFKKCPNKRPKFNNSNINIAFIIVWCIQKSWIEWSYTYRTGKFIATRFQWCYDCVTQKMFLQYSSTTWKLDFRLAMLVDCFGEMILKGSFFGWKKEHGLTNHWMYAYFVAFTQGRSFIRKLYCTDWRMNLVLPRKRLYLNLKLRGFWLCQTSGENEDNWEARKDVFKSFVPQSC